MAEIGYILLFILGVAADAAAKLFAAASLSESAGAVTLIPGILSLMYAENTGAAFSTLQGMRWLLVPITVAALAVIAYVLYKKIITDTAEKLAIVFIATGAVGNLIDRVLRGYVIDMIKLDFINFPIFNIADIFVTAGTALLLIYALFMQKPDGDERHGSKQEAESRDGADLTGRESSDSDEGEKNTAGCENNDCKSEDSAEDNRSRDKNGAYDDRKHEGCVNDSGANDSGEDDSGADGDDSIDDGTNDGGETK